MLEYTVCATVVWLPAASATSAVTVNAPRVKPVTSADHWPVPALYVAFTAACTPSLTFTAVVATSVGTFAKLNCTASANTFAPPAVLITGAFGATVSIVTFAAKLALFVLPAASTEFTTTAVLVALSPAATV